jgi:protein-S-isoprenylcysteine O-methyltransferase Ste14
MSEDHPQVIALPPALYAGAFIVGLILEFFWRTRVLGPALRVGFGGALFVIGSVIMLYGVAAFRSAGTNVEVYRPATSLVVMGPYRLSRNPIYVGMTIAYVGAAILADSLWALTLVLPVVVIIHYGVVLREEPYLAAKFGAAYREYTRKVRRWV